MTPEQKLAVLFAAEAPPARDYAFQAGVAQRIAVRRAWLTVAALLPWAIAAMAVLWALAPVLGPATEGLVEAVEPLAVLLLAAGVAGAGALWLSRRFSAG